MVLLRNANPSVVIYYKFTINPGGFRYCFFLPILLEKEQNAKFDVHSAS
jgi:hypothetical protein